MLKVIDVFPVGDMLSVTLEGSCSDIKSGSKLTDSGGNTVTVESVAMTRYDDPSDISKTTTIMVDFCKLRKGDTLTV
jgi:hypothetical protein